MALPNSPHWTPESYLTYDRDSDTKHEFIDGQPLAMSGASRAHNLLVTAIVSALYTGLRGRPCEVYPSDMRVQVGASGLYAYPDVVVVCGDPIFTDGHVDTLSNPTLLVEVLSESTERRDRGVKFQGYRELSSLREYLLVSQTAPRVERYLRGNDNTWTLTDAQGRDAVLHLPSINFTLSLSAVYERLDFGA